MSKEEIDLLAATHGLFIQSTKNGDVAGLISLFCEDAIFMPPNEPSLYGRSEIREWYEDYIQHFRIVTITETEREVDFIGNGCVLERWAYMISIAPLKGGDRIRDDGRFFTVWKRESDGKWRISHAIFNSIRPVGSGTSRFISRMAERKGAKGRRA